MNVCQGFEHVTIASQSKKSCMKSYKVRFFLDPREELLIINGYIKLLPGSKVEVNSCLKITVIDTIQCNLEEAGCDRKIYCRKKIYVFVKLEEKIRYSINVKLDSEIFYEIEAIINNGWCGDSIRKGNFLNGETH